MIEDDPLSSVEIFHVALRDLLSNPEIQASLSEHLLAKGTTVEPSDVPLLLIEALLQLQLQLQLR